MKRICFIGNYHQYSGALEVFRSVASHMKNRGWKTAYFYHKTRMGERIPPMNMFDEVKHIDDERPREAISSEMAQCANDYDIVHTSLLPMDWRFLFKAMCRRPMLETYHSADGWSRIWMQYRIRLNAGVEKLPNYIVAVSNGLGAKINGDLLMAGQSACSTVIYNGVKIPSVYSDGRGRYLTYAGRIANGKGLQEWLKIAWRIRRRCPDTRFQWIGSLSPDYDPNEFRKLQANFPWLSVTGYQSNLTPYYQRASCLLMTSPSEGLPMVILEAMAHGIPCVSYAAGDIRETGCIIVQNAKDAENKVVELQMKERLNIVDQLRCRAKEQFNIESMNQQHEQLYLSLV